MRGESTEPGSLTWVAFMENLRWPKIPDPVFETTLLFFASLVIGLLILEQQNKLEFGWFFIAKSVAWEEKDLLEWERFKEKISFGWWEDVRASCYYSVGHCSCRGLRVGKWSWFSYLWFFLYFLKKKTGGDWSKQRCKGKRQWQRRRENGFLKLPIRLRTQ